MDIHVCVCVCVWTYVCVCVCVCVSQGSRRSFGSNRKSWIEWQRGKCESKPTEARGVSKK